MKKTIAILLVLVIGMVGVWADGVENTLGNEAEIVITTSVTPVALFGVSAAALVEADYANATAFNGKVSASITKDIADINTLKALTTVGWLSGFNNTGTKFTLSVSITDLVNQDIATADPLSLTVTPSTNQEVPAATDVRGKLDSVEIKVQGVEAEIDLAPAGDYEATITFEVVANA
jgi:hypothetical protein